ncbi:MAG TPA: DNA repair protein RecN, partial [Verrucomicrobiae bacterium]|nr:DNA repair protein RecN [Verrucomicrobiae bacterium]
LLEHEVEEITGARPVAGEAAAIRSRLDASRHGEAIARGSVALAGLLAGADGEAEGTPGAYEQASRAAAEAAGLARLDARYGPLVERLAGAAAELEDVASEARRLSETLDHDPAALAALEARLSALYSLERRYGTDVDGLVGRAEEASAEIDRLRHLGTEREWRRADAERLLAAVAATCAALSSRRAGAATELAAAIETAVAGLGLREMRVQVAVGRRIASPDEPAVELDGDAVAFDATGADVVVFLIAPNPGEPARPLAKIASGGELSRLALAIEEVLAAADATPTLVFDEIDSGIGGRSADPVAQTLWLLGRRHQVLCVTHLPQIAAHADAHFGIRKVERGGRTVTEVRRLTDDDRVEELAAMIGGPAAGAAATASARDLLDRAAAFRSSRAGPARARR